MVETAGNGSEEEAPRGTVIRQFRPHWRVLLAVMAWGVLALGLLVAIPIVGDSLEPGVRWALAGLVVAGWVWVSARDLVSYFSTKYVLTDEQIIVQTGVLKITKAKIPLESIDNITMTRNVLERMLGYGDMVIESTQGANVFADIPDPEEFEAEVLRHRNARRQQGGGSAPAPAAPVERDPVQRLAELADLHDRGAITDAEFEAKKARLLDEI